MTRAGTVRGGARVAALLALLGCTSSTTPIRLPDCTEGERAACLCEGTWQGVQTCEADRRWGACACGDGGAMVTPAPACSEPFALCNGVCVSLLVDPAHCGRCSSPCPAGQFCLGGGCALLADAGGPRPDATATDAATGDAAVDATERDAATGDAATGDDVVTKDAATADATAATDAETDAATDAATDATDATDATGGDAPADDVAVDP